MVTSLAKLGDGIFAILIVTFIFLLSFIVYVAYLIFNLFFFWLKIGKKKETTNKHDNGSQ